MGEIRPNMQMPPAPGPTTTAEMMPNRPGDPCSISNFPLGPLHCRADNMHGLPVIASTAAWPPRPPKRTWAQMQEAVAPAPEVAANTSAAAAVAPDHVRLVSTRHGAIEVPWKAFWMALLKMFANQNCGDLKTKFCQGRKPPSFSDGYSWRKYGQKALARQNRFRLYYRCTFPGCNAKKRAEVDPSTGYADRVVTSEHNHPPPGPRKKKQQEPTEHDQGIVATQKIPEPGPQLGCVSSLGLLPVCAPC